MERLARAEAHATEKGDRDQRKFVAWASARAKQPGKSRTAYWPTPKSVVNSPYDDRVMIESRISEIWDLRADGSQGLSPSTQK